MSNAQARAYARAAVRGVAGLGGRVVTYHGAGGDVSVDGYIERSTGLLGVQVQLGEPRHRAVLLLEDIGEARAGERLTDEDGTVWYLNDELDNDGFVVSWSVEKR